MIGEKNRRGRSFFWGHRVLAAGGRPAVVVASADAGALAGRRCGATSEATGPTSTNGDAMDGGPAGSVAA